MYLKIIEESLNIEDAKKIICEARAFKEYYQIVQAFEKSDQ